MVVWVSLESLKNWWKGIRSQVENPVPSTSRLCHLGKLNSIHSYQALIGVVIRVVNDNLSCWEKSPKASHDSTLVGFPCEIVR